VIQKNMAETVGTRGPSNGILRCEWTGEMIPGHSVQGRGNENPCGKTKPFFQVSLVGEKKVRGRKIQNTGEKKTLVKRPSNM